MKSSWRKVLGTSLVLVLAGILHAPAAMAAPGSPGEAHAPEHGSDHRARRLIRDLREELAPVEAQIRNHPYLDALEAGEVSLANLRAFAGEQYHVIQSDLRSAAKLVARFGATPSGPFFQGILDGEILARAYLLRFAGALGLDEEDLQAYEPNPRAQTYPSYVTWLSVHASDGQVATAYLVNFAVFGENLGRMGAALRDRYGFSADDTAYFDFFAVLPPDFEPDALAIIERTLRSCSDVRQIKRSARLLQAYELDFWDAVAEN